jgi:hypothetical protein
VQLRTSYNRVDGLASCNWRGPPLTQENTITYSSGSFLGLGILIFRPVPIPDEKDCLSLKGMVSEVYEGGVNDVVFKLQGLDKEFYINRD